MNAEFLFLWVVIVGSGCVCFFGLWTLIEWADGKYIDADGF